MTARTPRNPAGATYLILGTSIVLTVSAARPATTQQTATIPRLTEPVALDGTSAEPAWRDALPLPLTVYEPTFGAAPTQRTEILIGHDGRHLLVAGRLYDREPDRIRTVSLTRDLWSGDDALGIIVDSFDDDQNARWFYTNPAGVRFDEEISNDAEQVGPRPPFNRDWNGFWDVVTRTGADGWHVEMRIPFSSLGLPSGDAVEIGLIAYRFIARANERQTYPAIPPDWAFGYIKPSVAAAMRLDNVSSARPLYVSPYLLGGSTAESQLDPGGTHFALDDEMAREVGFDLRYAMGSGRSLDLTVNTDFAQVEADDQQVNLSRFSLFFPEKRKFFQERSAIFDFGSGAGARSTDRVFHSRQIGLRQGRPVPILGGARFVGRFGAWDVGGLNVQTQADRGHPGENFGVFRLRRRVINALSEAGVIVASRVDAQGAYNVTYGVDGEVNVSGAHFLNAELAQTVDDASSFDPVRSASAHLGWERRGRRGWLYEVNLARSGPDYRPDIGFVTRRDFTQLQGRVGYGWAPGQGSPFRSMTPNFLFTDVFLRNADRSIESLFSGSFFNFELKSGARGFVGAILRVEDLREPLMFPDASLVPAGHHRFLSMNSGLTLARTGAATLSSNFGFGRFFDGWRVNGRVTPTWNVSRHLELENEYQVDVVWFAARAGFVSHIVRLRARAALDKHLSGALFLQYSSTADLIAPNVRVRYNFAEGHDLWAVFDAGLNTARSGVQPRLPLTERRSVLVKYTYTLGV